ncbi:MAG: hypothetical protein RIS76_1115 [Verrucomicrobiota bacterium]|jgi:hypothetical protein
MSLGTASESSSPTAEVARPQIRRIHASELSPEQFFEEHWLTGVPLVLQDATKVWGAYGKFSPDWFREHYGDRRTTVAGVSYTMREVMDLVEGRDTGRPIPYPCKYSIPTQLPELLPMLRPLGLGYARPNWLERSWFRRGYWGSALELFIGGTGGKFPYAHLDYYHLSAWINQLYGNKEFTVWPRGQEPCLYPDPKDNWKSLIPDVENVDLNRFPLYRQATPITFVVGAGETLYIPVGLWHTTKSLEPTISVAFDLLNRQNFPAFLKDVWNFRRRTSLAQAIGYSGYAFAAGTLCRMGDTFERR